MKENAMKSLKRALIGVAALSAVSASPAHAGCSYDPYLGSICIVAFTFCPRGYADASGQLMSISQNTALFSLLGTTYGGNGQTTFALPDLRGRVPRGIGQAPGLSNVDQGEASGQETVTLTIAQMPAHTHAVSLNATSAPGNADSPAGALPAKSAPASNYGTGTANATLAVGAVGVAPSGGNQPHTVIDPYLGLRYCIAIEGVYPSRP
jgi:microcystin-dependent protein